jgi:hypothetical protein
VSDGSAACKSYAVLFTNENLLDRLAWCCLGAVCRV